MSGGDTGSACESGFDLDLPGPAETAAVGRALGAAVRAGDLLALEGELGAGKTSLVRGLAEGLGVDPAGVSSPTFVRLVEHEPRPGAGPAAPWLVHADAYRMSGAAELEDLGWGDELLAGSVVAVEWASRVAEALPADRLALDLTHAPGGGRRLRVRGLGGWRPRLAALEPALRDAAAGG